MAVVRRGAGQNGSTALRHSGNERHESRYQVARPPCTAGW